VGRQLYFQVEIDHALHLEGVTGKQDREKSNPRGVKGKGNGSSLGQRGRHHYGLPREGGRKKRRMGRRTQSDGRMEKKVCGIGKEN